MSGMGLPPPPGPPPQPPGPPSWPPAGTAHSSRPGPVAVRPLNLGEVLDGAFKLFVANWRTILLVAGIFIVPLQLLAAYLQRDLMGAGLLEMFTDPSAAEAFLETGGPGEDGAVLLGAVNGVLITPLVTGAVVAVVAASYLGGETTTGAALGSAVRRWWALIASWLLLLLATGVPFAVAGALIAAAAVVGLPVPVVVLVGIVLVLGAIAAALAASALFAAAVPAIVVERLGPVQGLARSWRLLRPRLLPVLGTIVLTALLVMVIGMALGGVPQFLGLLVGGLGWLLVAVGSILAGLVTTPLLAIVLTLLYFDGRVRQEGLDLRLAADNLASPPGGWGPADGSSAPRL